VFIPRNLKIPFVFLVGLLVLSVAWFVAFQSHTKMEPNFYQPSGPPLVSRGPLVVAYHPDARRIGEEVLNSGGNAFDAFIAVVAAENVLAEGASSLAGPLSVLTYDASDGQVSYLDADFNDPLDSTDRWDGDESHIGCAVLAPGAPAGLRALGEKYGTRPFSKLLEPAIGLARDGFPVNHLMAAFIAWRSKVLQRTAYGRRTFFRRGRPLAPGETLQLPEVAAFLSNLAQQGTSYVYTGDWGKRFITVVQAQGGRLTSKDLAAYRPFWTEPWKATYRGYQIYSSSGRSYGGVWSLLALKTIEHANISTSIHHSENAEAMENLVRVARQVWSEPWDIDYRALDNRDLVASRLTSEYTEHIWERVRDKAPDHILGSDGSHSYQIIVIDKDGNIANGTTTIETDPWGEGIFVEGVPLSTAGMIPWHTAPGERRLSPFSSHIAFRDGKPQFILGTISNSLVEAGFQLMTNLMDYHLPVEQAVSLPRFGTFPPVADSKGLVAGFDSNWLDPRIDPEIVHTLEKHGLKFQRAGFIDTGLGAVAAIDANGIRTGVTVPLPYIKDPFGYK
jgi:gamma-glutamyltranspeptidase / glutathione hydrolase